MKIGRLISEKNSWSKYWQSVGAPDSCCPNAPAEFEHCLESFWRNSSANIPFGARVLDAACGRGAVLRLLKSFRADLAMLGVDYAVGPGANDGLDILYDTDCRELPFNSGEFDAVLSQFGIEYSGLEGLAECLRILKDKATISLVIHHASSVIVRSSRRRYDALFDLTNSQLFILATDAATGKVPIGVDALLRELASKHAGNSIIKEIYSALIAVLNGPDTLQGIARIEELAAAELQRLRAQTTCALDDCQFGNWERFLQERGFRVQRQILKMVSGDIAGWALTAARHHF